MRNCETTQDATSIQLKIHLDNEQRVLALLNATIYALATSGRSPDGRLVIPQAGKALIVKRRE